MPAFLPFVLFLGPDTDFLAVQLHAMCRWNTATYCTFQVDEVSRLVASRLRPEADLVVVICLPTLSDAEADYTANVVDAALAPRVTGSERLLVIVVNPTIELFSPTTRVGGVNFRTRKHGGNHGLVQFITEALAARSSSDQP